MAARTVRPVKSTSSTSTTSLLLMSTGISLAATTGCCETVERSSR